MTFKSKKSYILNLPNYRLNFPTKNSNWRTGAIVGLTKSHVISMNFHFRYAIKYQHTNHFQNVSAIRTAVQYMNVIRIAAI